MRRMDLIYLKKILLEHNIDTSQIAVLVGNIIPGYTSDVVVEEEYGIKIIKRVAGGND